MLSKIAKSINEVKRNLGFKKRNLKILLVRRIFMSIVQREIDQETGESLQIPAAKSVIKSSIKHLSLKLSEKMVSVKFYIL